MIGLGLSIPEVAVRSGPSGPTFSPTSLFLGDTGAWYDATDLTTLFQDSAGTTPVTTAGQPVGKMLDKSGNGKHLIQATAGFRPLYQSGGGILFDGVDDFLQLAFTLNQPVTRVSCAKLVAWVSGRYFWDGASPGNLGALFMSGSTPQIQTYSGVLGPLDATHMTVGATHVVTEQINGASSKLAVDNNAYATGDQGAINPQGTTIGTVGAGTFAGNILFFGAIHIGRILSDPDIANCRTYFGAKAGLTL